MTFLLRPATLATAGVVLFILAFQFWISPSNPPGFHHDEAAFALNGYTLAHHLQDQNGAHLPVIFPSFQDYKGAFFSYILAPPIAVFGPSNGVARAVAAFFGFVAVALAGLIAYRRSGPLVAVIIFLLAGLTPWLFQLGRVAYDTSLFPFATAFVVLSVEIWSRRTSTRVALPALLVGVSLAVMTYAYGAGRLLGPLLALALLLFFGRVPLRSIATAWCVYAICLIPLVLYRIHHPVGLTARYDATKFDTSGMSALGVAGHAFANYLHDLNPWHWVVSGDRKPYVDVWGAPQLLAIVVLVAAVGVGEILVHRRRDRFWWYVIAAYLLSAVPASLTADRHDALRLSAMPLCVALLAIPGVEALSRLRRPFGLAAVAAVSLAAVVQWGFFVNTYTSRGDARTAVFEADLPSLIARGLAGGQTIYVDHDDPYALTQGQWYAVSHDLPASRVVRLTDGGIPPTGSMVLGRTQACDYVCDRLGEADEFFLARAVGPNP